MTKAKWSDLLHLTPDEIYAYVEKTNASKIFMEWADDHIKYCKECNMLICAAYGFCQLQDEKVSDKAFVPKELQKETKAAT